MSAPLRAEPVPPDTPRQARWVWIGSGIAMLVIAWGVHRDLAMLANVLIPAGAWALLRGLTA